MGLEPVWLQNALPVLQLHCENDDFEALGFRMPREAILGMEPVWLQSGLPVFHCHCENDDFGAFGFRKPWEAFLCLQPVWLSENPSIAFKMRRCGKTEIALRESCRPPPRAPVGENNSTAHLCEQIEVNSD